MLFIAATLTLTNGISFGHDIVPTRFIAFVATVFFLCERVKATHDIIRVVNIIAQALRAEATDIFFLFLFINPKSKSLFEHCIYPSDKLLIIYCSYIVFQIFFVDRLNLFQYYTTAEIVKIVNRLIDRCGTRNPYRVAKELGINIIYRNFDKQRGAYKVILKNRFIFLKSGMHPVVEQIVLWHEIGHDILHRQEAVAAGGFKEFNIFDMRENRMEYEANIFASQASLPDDTILEYIENGYDIQQIARAMSSDINLIALKVDTLIAQGYQLRKQDHRNDFLKYNHKI